MCFNASSLLLNCILCYIFTNTLARLWQWQFCFILGAFNALFPLWITYCVRRSCGSSCILIILRNFHLWLFHHLLTINGQQQLVKATPYIFWLLLHTQTGFLYKPLAYIPNTNYKLIRSKFFEIYTNTIKLLLAVLVFLLKMILSAKLF